MAKILLESEELTDAIFDLLTEYKKDVADKVYKAGHKAIKEIERKTIDTAPIGRRAAGDHFRESIASKSERDRLGNSTHIWYVKAPNYRLTHLLVRGHAKRNGGITRADPFLKNATKEVYKQYLDDVERAIKNGG